MTDKIQLMTITLMTTILLTGGIVPYSFANNDNNDYEDRDCETPAVLEVMYNGPDNAHVEIYKLKKHAKNNDKMLYEFPEYFNNGDYIKLNSKDHMDKDALKKKITYKISHAASSKYLTFDLSCRTPLAIGDINTDGDEDDNDRVSLTIMYGGDLDEIPVIFEDYHVETYHTTQACEGEIIDFTTTAGGVTLDHSALDSDIREYLLALGFEYSVSSDTSQGSIFNANIPESQIDPDLVNPRPVADPPINNMLIVQEHAQPSEADDDADGGIHTLKVIDGKVNFHSLRIIDIDNNAEAETSFVRGFDSVGATVPIAETPFIKTENNNQKLLQLNGFVNLEKIEIELGGSGAVANLCFEDVIPPDIKITLNKEINNDDALPGDDIVTDPNAFELEITDAGGIKVPVLSGEQKTFTEAGMFTFNEADLDNYVATVSGENCPVDTIPGDATLALGDVVECNILNTFVPPPVLTLKKALTNDNGGEAIPSDFVVKFWDEQGPSAGNLVKQVRFDATTSLVVISDLPPADYVITEELLLAGDDLMYDTEDDELDTTSYTTVLVAGDTLCPSMENELFRLDVGNKITCTIYNDDNGGPPTTGGGDGIIFHRGTIEFQYNAIGDDPPGVGVTQSNGVAFDCSPGLTCISIDNVMENPKLFTVQDMKINKASSLVVINIYALDETGNEDAFAQKCIVGTLLPGSTTGTLDFTFECETIEGQSNLPMEDPPVMSLGKYRINYAVIDTEIII